MTSDLRPVIKIDRGENTMPEVVKIEAGQPGYNGQARRSGLTGQAGQPGRPGQIRKLSKQAVTAIRHRQPPQHDSTAVQAIPAVQYTEEVTKPKVAAYCRISSLLESQQTSIESQRAHYEQEIRCNDSWEFAGVYIETGVTGTKAEIRPELQRMMADCRDGKINMILTKSISRFARNTSDCLELVRELSKLGVRICFDKENIDTGAMDSEFMLSILACMAEDESRSISGNMKWSIRKRFESGNYRQSVEPYGYKRSSASPASGGPLIPLPSEAAVIRRIFDMVLSGHGMNRIAKALNSEHIPSPMGKRWTETTLRKIIANSVYKGDTLYQKTYRDEQYKQRRNKGELDMYYNVGAHEGIISEDDFEKAQLAVRQHAKGVGYGTGDKAGGTGEKQRSANRYCFSKKLYCLTCGSIMHRQVHRGNLQPSWVCHQHAGNPELCTMKPVGDEDLRRAFINCMNKLAWLQKNKDSSFHILDMYSDEVQSTESLAAEQRLKELDAEIQAIERESRKLNAVIMRERFLPEHREKKLRLTSQLRALLAEKSRIQVKGIKSGTVHELIKAVAAWRVSNDVAAFPEEAFIRFVERCTVNSGKTVTFHFTCGLELSESLYRTELE